MGQGLEYLSFELSQRIGHDIYHIRKFEYYLSKPPIGANLNTPILNSRRVLVADDEKVIADTLRMILSQSGFHAEAVYDGNSAIERAQEWKPDILLCDVIMPGINGIDVAIQIRSLIPDCRILLLSGRAGVNDLMREARGQGHQFDLLVKPVYPGDLIRLLRSDS
jgi:CheY-like chemotaxis protein